MASSLDQIKMTESWLEFDQKIAGSFWTNYNLLLTLQTSGLLSVHMLYHQATTAGWFNIIYDNGFNAWYFLLLIRDH